MLTLAVPAVAIKHGGEAGCLNKNLAINTIASVGRGDSSHFPHIYNSTKTGGAGIVCSSVMVVPHMTFMHSEYP